MVFKTLFSRPKPIEHDRRQGTAHFECVKPKGKWIFGAMKAMAFTIVFVPGWMLYRQFAFLSSMHPVNPHYDHTACTICHTDAKPHIDVNGVCVCADCHDMQTMTMHKDKPMPSKPDCQMGAMPPLIELCTRCHGRSGYMQIVHRNGTPVDVDITLTHPVNQRVNSVTYPRTFLPLNDGKMINCSTCHNVHIEKRGLMMLRMTSMDRNGRRDPTALCHNCHVDNGVL